MNHKILRTNLQCLGVNVPEEHAGRKGGAGPSEGQVIIVNGTYISVPTDSWFVKDSPYHIVKKSGSFYLIENNHELCEVSFPVSPEYYKLKTDAGISLEKIAIIHGKDCLASTVYQDCCYFEQGTPAAFAVSDCLLRMKRRLKKKKWGPGCRSFKSRRI